MSRIRTSRSCSAASFLFEIIEGPHVVIRKLDFKGANSVSKDRLRDQVKSATWFPIFSPGKYDPDIVDQDVAALREYYKARTGFFDVRRRPQTDLLARSERDGNRFS